jgi:hypothetical protein
VIAGALRINSVLQKINRSGNEIGDDVARAAIADALEFNSSLQEMDLEYNEIEICHEAFEGCRNPRNQNHRLWICSCIDDLAMMQRLCFDCHMFSFYFYSLLRIQLSK